VLKTEENYPAEDSTMLIRYAHFFYLCFPIR